eukprot:1682770-Rhodomonas_salina.1
MPFVVVYLYYTLYPSVANAGGNADAGEVNCSRSGGSVEEEGRFVAKWEEGTTGTSRGQQRFQTPPVRAVAAAMRPP